MKIGGKQLAERNKASVTLKRGDDSFVLTLVSLPPGWESRIRSLGVVEYPNVPRIMRTSASGKPIRGEDGKAIFDENYKDPDYVAGVMKINQRFAALQLAEMLAEDPTVEFEAKRPVSNTGEEWKAYGDALAAEIFNPASGFTTEEVEGLTEIGAKLESRLNVDEAYKDFLSHD